MKALKNTPTIIAIVVAILGVIAYFVWLRPQPEPNVSFDGTMPSSEAQATFLELAEQLNTISFDTSIFNDPRFRALVDIKTAILPEAAGRTDPFAPLPGVPRQ